MKTALKPRLRSPVVFIPAVPTDDQVQGTSQGPSPGTAAEEPACWTTLIGDQEWRVYLAAIQALRRAQIRFLLGGAFGLAAYTGRCRNTKDMDLFLLPADREAGVEALTEAGFSDYYEKAAYDRGWIYRATRDGMIVDLIWGTPNRRGTVDEKWFEGARALRIRDELVEAIPAEELLWIKLFVLQRDRCDWPDVLNLLEATSSFLDWDRVLERLGPDRPLLQGLVCVFAWLCPGRMSEIPWELRQQWRPPGADDPSELRQDRINLLDTRPWFAALQPCDKPMGR